MTSFLCAAEPKITVHLLDYTRESDTENKLTRRVEGDKRPLFWIDWSKKWRAIDSTKALSGREASDLIALMRQNLADSEAGHFCGHDPIYGIEFTDSDGKTLITSLCFKCGTWVQPDKRLNISGKPMGIEHPLCQALRKVIELPKVMLVKNPTRNLQPVPMDQEATKRIISAIESYRKVLASKDYKRLYQECTHSAFKKQVTEKQFADQMAEASGLLAKFFDDVLAAYAKNGGADADFQIGAMPYPYIPGALINAPGSVIIQFADRIKAEHKERWPKGVPIRIQLAPDGETLRFYDID